MIIHIKRIETDNYRKSFWIVVEFVRSISKTELDLKTQDVSARGVRFAV